MRKLLVPIMASLFLAACAAPLPIKIASWAFDGISYLSTGKSITDHGLSLVAQKDCALWRPVKGEKICSDIVDPDEVLVADVSGKIGSVRNTPAVEAILIDEEDASAPKGDPSLVAAEFGEDIQASAPTEIEGLKKREGEDINGLGSIATAVQAVTLPYSVTGDGRAMIIKVSLKDIIVDEPKKIPAPVVPSATLNGGFYYVIGSFRRDINARERVAEQSVFAPRIVVKLRDDGGRQYRVVVGPVPVERRQALRRQIVDAGIPDVWALRMRSQAMLAALLGNTSGNS